MGGVKPMIKKEPEKKPVVIWQNPFPKGSREAREETRRVVRGCVEANRKQG